MAFLNIISIHTYSTSLCTGTEENNDREFKSTTTTFSAEIGQAAQISWVSSHDLTNATLRVGKYGPDGPGYIFIKESDMEDFWSTKDRDTNIRTSLEKGDRQIVLSFEELKHSDSGTYIAEVKWQNADTYENATIAVEVTGR